MRSYFLLTAFYFLFLNFTSKAQSVSINTDGARPSDGAILDVSSKDKGILIPRIPLEGNDDEYTVPNMIQSLLIYNTKFVEGSNAVYPGYYYWNGSRWVRLITNENSLFGGWLLGGNAYTSPSTHFLGTTDNNSLVFKVNNQKAGYIGVQANDGNVFWGFQSGNNNTGYSNVGIGVKALYRNTDISNLVAIGDSALFSDSSGSENTAIGSKSLYSNISGVSNTAIGYQALYSNTWGNFNSANGFQALFKNISGYDNTANGASSLYNNTTGDFNTANGYLALYKNTTGSRNTAQGLMALFNNTTGKFNTAIGEEAYRNSGTGSNNTALGYAADGYEDLNNATAIGANAFVTASNKVRIGNSTVTVIEGQVPFTSPSDGRFKFNIREDVSGLDFILKLRPITYQFDVKRFDENLRSSLPAKQNNDIMEASYNEASAIRRTGFIAQEVEKAANESGYEFSGIIKPKSGRDHYGLSYESFVVPLVKAMQEQQKIIDSQNLKIAKLQEPERIIDVLNKKIDQQNEQIMSEKDDLNKLRTELEELKYMILKLYGK
jgi:trimeric autotransporter adhesin